MQRIAGAKYFPCSWFPSVAEHSRSPSFAEQSEWYTTFLKENSTLMFNYRCRMIGGAAAQAMVGWPQRMKISPFVTLINPFRKVLPITLPRLVVPTNYERHPIECKKQYEYYVPKVILSADPLLNPDNYVVVAIYDLVYRQLAFIKAGQKSWTYIKETLGFFYVNFYNSQIYAVQNGGEVVSLDVSSSNDPSRPPTMNQLTPPLPSYNEKYPFPFPDMGYLVKSTRGDLLHVRRFFRSKKQDDNFIESFAVYKLVFNENDGSVVKQLEVESIGDDALFLGDNHSISISASSFHKCKPNSIYYTNDTIHPIPRGMGIFSLATRTISQHALPSKSQSEEHPASNMD